MSDKPKWTEGEWSVVEGREIWVVTSGVEDIPVADAFGKFTENETANAHLISAAPNLYAACEAALKVLSEPRNFGKYSHVMNGIDFALRKARGHG